MKRIAGVLACALGRWFADNGSATAAALAFYCAFSLAPLLVIVLTLAGWIVDAQAASHFVHDQLTMLFGADTAKVLMEAVQTSQDHEGYLATAVSIATLLVAATTVLAELEQALNRIWGARARPHSGLVMWIRRRVLSLGFILALSFLLLVTLTISTMIAGMRSWLAERHAPLLGAVGTLDLLISVGTITALFALIFRYMPSHRLPWKVVFGGGLVTALLFVLGKWLVGLYLAKSTVPSAFGAAASFAALLLWLYYTAQIFLLGAEFTACLGGLTRQAPNSQGQASQVAGRRLGRRGQGQ
jgi:membrane protein